MSDNPEDYELVHYGVKGMKWGRRKAEAVGSAIAGAEKKRMEFAKEHGYGAQIKKASGRLAEKKEASKERFGNANVLGRNTIRSLEAQKKNFEKARDGKGLIGLAAQADKATWGRKGRYENYANMHIAHISKNVAAIKRGEDFLERSGIAVKSATR